MAESANQLVWMEPVTWTRRGDGRPRNPVTVETASSNLVGSAKFMWALVQSAGHSPVERGIRVRIPVPTQF